MVQFFAQTNDLVPGIRPLFEQYYFPILPWLELIAVVVSALFLAGIVYAIIKSSWLAYKVDNWIDVLNAGNLSRRRTLRVWKEITDQIKTDVPKNWKLAVMGCDKVLGDILVMAGYPGGDVHERLDRVPPGVLTNIEQLRNVHRLRDKIVREPDFALSKEETETAIEIYRVAFIELGLLDQ